MTASGQLPREEYIEQEYFFRVYRERLDDNIPSQEILRTVQEELLSTCQLPLAVDILRTEIMHSGRLAPAMKRLSHYFTAFQTFVIDRAEDDRSRFEQKTALQILEREARYRAAEVSPAGLFMYQLECISRNRLGYHSGLDAIAQDAIYDDRWKRWFRFLSLQLGARDLAELVYRASEHYRHSRMSRSARQTSPAPPAADDLPALFGRQEGRIARASIGRDPVHFFAALQRQLNYPTVPVLRETPSDRIPPAVEARLVRIEQRLKLVEMEQRGGIDLSRFYARHRTMDDADENDADPG